MSTRENEEGGQLVTLKQGAGLTGLEGTVISKLKGRYGEGKNCTDRDGCGGDVCEGIDPKAGFSMWVVEEGCEDVEALAMANTPSVRLWPECARAVGNVGTISEFATWRPIRALNRKATCRCARTSSSHLRWTE